MSEENEDTTGVWKEGLAGDNAERLEALGKFESADKFLEHYDSLVDADWRVPIAGDDDKFKSELDRYSTPLDFGKSWREQKSTISAGVKATVPGEDATDDELKFYREANNIPLESSGYMENLPDGLVVGEADKEIMGDFMSTLHKHNVSPQVGHAVIEWYNNFAADQQDANAEADVEHKQEFEDAMRQQWGNDYRGNINLAGALIEGAFGKEGKELFLGARDENGRALMNIPGVVEGLVDISRKWNPSAQLVPPGGDPVQTLNDEIAELEKFMKDKRTEYFSEAGKPKRERLNQLYDIRIKQQAAA